ncbi:MAG: DoxX family protein [Chloroherpetonaceae bacterium]|nr:DoxX family protein [Chloroherpetonaceae bacterium]
MKNRKLFYWVATSLFAGFMGIPAIFDVIKTPEAVAFIGHLGYPEYFVPFIGVAKVLGAAAILIPQFDKIKEWAYAGLCFDLIGAVYSNLMVDGASAGMLFMIIPFTLLAVSYHLNQKVNAEVKTA